MHVCMYVGMYVYMCVYICMYICTCMYSSHTLISMGSLVANAHRHGVHMVAWWHGCIDIYESKHCVNRP